MKSEHAFYQAVVVDNADPLRRGRVRLVIPQVSGSSRTGWAEPADPHLARTHRVKNGTMVWMFFDGGSRSHPVYLPPAGAVLVPRIKALEEDVAALTERVNALEAP